MNESGMGEGWKRRLSHCLTAAVFLLLSACAQTTGDAILRSKNLIEVQGQYDQAIRVLEAELARNPSSAATWYWLGIGRYKKNNFTDAVKALERAFDLRLYKTYHLMAYDYLGWSYIFTGQNDKAINAFNMALKINSGFASSLLGRGKASLNKSDIDPAIDDLSRTLALLPYNVDALRYRGWAYFFKARYQEALADFDGAIRLSKSPFATQDALRGRGWTNFNLNNMQAALEDFEQALRTIDPSNRVGLQDAYRGRGLANQRMGNLESSLDDFDKALRYIDAGNRFVLQDVYRGRGWTNYYLGNFQAALRDFDEAIANIDPNNGIGFQDAYRGKAFALLGLGRDNEATAFIAKANDAMNYDASQDLSRMHYAMGDKQKAWAYRGGEGFVGATLHDYAEGTVKGARIADVVPGGPAARADLRQGDIIIGLDYRQISSGSVFAREIAKVRPGQSVIAAILRDGRQTTRHITIASAEPLMEGDGLIAPVLNSRRGTIMQAAVTTPPAQPVAAEPAPIASPAAFGGISQAWAVVIGISKYRYATQEGLTNLVFADDDARAFTRSLAALGWNESHIRMLINEEATLRNVMIALESWLTKTGPDDLIVLFWSGHGFPDPEDPEKVYLACHDTDIRIPATGYRMDKVRQALEERRSRNVIVLADTCHAGKLITRGGKGISIVPDIDKMRREQTVPKGWIFMVGADSDRQAIEHTSWTNGAFTHSLLKGLAGGADGFESIAPKDGLITMRELRAYLNSVMPDETQRVLGVAKRPVITTSSGDPGIWNLSLQVP